jgi:hypothetical protein
MSGPVRLPLPGTGNNSIPVVNICNLLEPIGEGPLGTWHLLNFSSFLTLLAQTFELSYPLPTDNKEILRNPVTQSLGRPAKRPEAWRIDARSLLQSIFACCDLADRLINDLCGDGSLLAADEYLLR